MLAVRSAAQAVLVSLHTCQIACSPPLELPPCVDHPACSVQMHAWHGGALSGPSVRRSVYVTMYNTREQWYV